MYIYSKRFYLVWLQVCGALYMMPESSAHPTLACASVDTGIFHSPIIAFWLGMAHTLSSPMCSSHMMPPISPRSNEG